MHKRPVLNWMKEESQKNDNQQRLEKKKKILQEVINYMVKLLIKNDHFKRF